VILAIVVALTLVGVAVVVWLTVLQPH